MILSFFNDYSIFEVPSRFSYQHVVYLLIDVLYIIGLVFLCKKLSKKTVRIILISLASICCLIFLGRMFFGWEWSRIYNDGSKTTLLPLELCNMNIFITLLALIIDKNNFTDTSSSVTVADINNKLGTANKNAGIQVYAMDRMIIVTFDSEKDVEFTMSAVNTELKKAGYNILAIDDSTSQAFASSYVYHNVLISVLALGNVSTKNELFDSVININAPVTNGNAGSSMHEVNEGEDIGNIAVSFTSDIEFTVDTVISLDGVRVSKIDTNKPGVYEVKHVATDAMGRTNRVNKTVVVNPKNAETAEAKVVEEVKSVTTSASSQVKVTSETNNDLSINTIKANNANNVIAIIEKKDSKKRKEESEDEE